MKIRFSFLLFFCLAFTAMKAQQETVVKGRVFEKGKPEPLPFVSMYFKGTKTGTTTDFDGNFILRTNQPVDTLVISYVGYKTVKKKIRSGQVQQFNVEMESNSKELQEVVIRPGENPALRIIRKAQENRDKNDQRNLSAYEYDSYNKVDVSLNNISEKMKEKKIFAPIKGLFDTTAQMKNEEGKYILPIFISESFSRYYYQENPSKTKEIVKASSSTGIGVGEKSYVTDLLGTSLLQFNFNQNWMRFLGKDFISPIAFGSNTYYIYTLLDSVDIDGVKCYKIRLNLRREEDLGFLGTMWITDSTFAIKRIHVEISKSANINFIDRLKIQQEMQQTESGQWLPSKTRVIIEIARISEESSGMVCKMYTVNSNIVVNKPKAPGFYDYLIEKEEDVFEKDTSFWQIVRPEKFTTVETQMFRMVDSVKTLPVIKTYVDIIRIVVEGYHRSGGFDFGPYVFLIGYNDVEKLRFRVGFRTNQFFSKNWQFKAYAAYGTGDNRLKGSVGADRIFSKRRWTVAGISYKNDYDLLGITDNTGQLGGTSNLFAAINIGNPRARINHTIEYKAHFLIAPKRDWTYRLTFQNTYFKPLGRFSFTYDMDGSGPPSAGNLINSFTNSVALFDIRYAYKEMMVVRGNDRVRMVRSRFPVLTLQYGRGLKGVWGGQYDYQRVSLNITQHLTTGVMGNADININTGKIFGSLPYPLLDIPRGNQSFLYTDFNYSLMNMYEFASDQFVQAMYIQHFEGLFTNRVPLLKKLHLRNFMTVKTAYGKLSDANKRRNFIDEYDALGGSMPGRDPGERLSDVHAFKRLPYVEASIGFENILRILSLSYVHRLTYLEMRHARKWGINLGLKIDF